MKPRLIRLLSVLVLLGGAAGQQSSFDGRWWRSLGDGEQVEFVAGYIDCYANDLGDKNHTFPESWYEYAPRITRYYEQNPNRLTRKVTRILFEVRSKHPPKPQAGGETWSEKHWFFDGQYWSQMGANEQVSYVDGYLACYREHLSSRPTKFSKAASVYVARISNWYDNVPTNSPQVIAKRERVAIADVLLKFADPQPISSR